MATKVDARRETASLIGSDKVEGTSVYGPDQRLTTRQSARNANNSTRSTLRTAKFWQRTDWATHGDRSPPQLVASRSLEVTSGMGISMSHPQSGQL
jgi:hypothetical protein